ARPAAELKRGEAPPEAAKTTQWVTTALLLPGLREKNSNGVNRALPNASWIRSNHYLPTPAQRVPRSFKAREISGEYEWVTTALSIPLTMQSAPLTFRSSGTDATFTGPFSDEHCCNSHDPRPHHARTRQAARPHAGGI